MATRVDQFTVGGGGQGAGDGQAAFLLVHAQGPALAGRRGVGTAAAHDVGSEGSIAALGQAGHTRGTFALADGRGGVALTSDGVGTVALAAVGAADADGLAHQVRADVGGEDAGQLDVAGLFAGLVEDGNFAHASTSVLTFLRLPCLEVVET